MFLNSYFISPCKEYIFPKNPNYLCILTNISANQLTTALDSTKTTVEEWFSANNNTNVANLVFDVISVHY